MQVLVTGAAGQLGQATCAALLAAGYAVRGVDTRFADVPGIDLELVDLKDTLAAYRTIRDVDAVVHLANHNIGGTRNDTKVFNDNVTVNMNVFSAAADRGAQRIVYASSIQACTSNRTIEDDAPSGLAYLPLDGRLPHVVANSYSLSKVTGELQLQYTAGAGPRENQAARTAVALRLPWLANPHTRWWRRIRERGLRSRPGWGQRLDECFAWLAVDDAAELVAACLAADLAGYHVFLPAAPTPAIDMSAEEIVAEFHPDVPWQPGADRTRLVDNTPVTRATGWAPRVERFEDLLAEPAGGA